jgi:putative phosphoribosyl transferase
LNSAAGLARDSVRLELGEVTLEGDLSLPTRPVGLVLFAHGSGSSRHSPRNRFVAGVLHEAGLATLLMDLLTADEEVLDDRSGELRFDVALLGRRLLGATEWLATDTRAASLPVGYFGASTGAAAALIAAAARPESVRAVVSRGGRPDLAGASLPRVQAPALLIVGGDDRHVLELNHAALAQLRSPKELVVVPGATHLFEEPGALERVAELAREWLVRYVSDTAAWRAAAQS